MDTIFMISKSIKTSDPHRLLLTDKINLKRSDNGKIQKSHSKVINLKYQLQHGIENLNYLMDHILYEIFKIIFDISFKNMKKRLIILQ